MDLIRRLRGIEVCFWTCVACLYGLFVLAGAAISGKISWAWWPVGAVIFLVMAGAFGLLVKYGSEGTPTAT